MKARLLRLLLVVALPLAAAASAVAAPDEPEPKAEISHAVDEVLSMHAAGVEPGLIISHLRSLPELPRLSAADLIQLRRSKVAPEVMSALILMTVPDKSRLSADDIVQLHTNGVPSDVISEMIQKARKTTELAAKNAAAAAPKTNPTYLLRMPVSSSVLIIPHRPYYYSPYYRGYYGPRYYGPTLSWGYGYGYHRSYCW